MKSLISAVVALVAVASAPSLALAGDPWLGVIIVDSSAGGASVVEVIPGSPAAAAGLRTQDIITRVDASAVGSASGLISAVSFLKVGGQVDVEYRRGGESHIVTTTLSERLTDNEILAHRLVDELFPEFRLPVVSGPASGDYDDLVGDVVVLYFATPSCQRCSVIDAAMVELSALAGVHVFAIDESTTSSLVANAGTKPARSKLGDSVTVVRDTGSMLRLQHLRTTASPIVVVVDRKRYVRYAALDGGIDVKDVKFAVRRALADDSP